MRDEFQSLIERCNRGDGQAWEEFYARYYGMVSAAVRRRVAGDSGEAEDTIQEVFIHLFRALKTYDPTRSLEAYILEIVRRVRISGYRKRSAMKRGGGNPVPRPLSVHDSNDEGAHVAAASRDTDQEAALIKAQEAHLLREALHDISETCRTLLGLRYDRGLSYSEIAISLDVKEVTLRSQVQRCLASLSRAYSRLSRQEEGRT